MTGSPPPDPQARRLLSRLGLPEALRQGVQGLLDAPGGTAGPLPPGWSLAADGYGGWRLLRRGPPGRPQPWAVGDRFGALHACARWHEDGAALAEAWFRLPGGGWLELAPGAGAFPLWGPSDELRLHAETPTPGAGRLAGRLAAVNYAAPQSLPPFDRPVALPPGAGSAVLNFLAGLLALEGGRSVPYRGPYPTPALFSVLCRSFAPEEPLETARALFTRDETTLAFRAQMTENPVRWAPAPFTAMCPAPGLTLHVRKGVETAWVRDVPFRPAPAAGGALASGERVWPEGDGFAVGLALLGRPYVRFFRLDATGTVTQAGPLPEGEQDAGDPDATPMDARWRTALCAWATLRAHAGLATTLAEADATLDMRWEPLPLRLADLRAQPDGRARLTVQAALAAEFRARAGREDAAGLAMMLVSDVLEACTPPLLRWAQVGLEAQAEAQAAPPPARLIAAGEAAQTAARRTLEQALPTLVQALVRGEALP